MCGVGVDGRLCLKNAIYVKIICDSLLFDSMRILTFNSRVKDTY